MTIYSLSFFLNFEPGHISWTFSKPWLLFSLLLSTPQSCGSPWYTEWGNKEVELFGRILNSCGIQALIHTHLFSPWEKLQAKMVSWPWVVPTLGRDNGRIKLFLIQSSICLIMDFCTLCAETSLRDSCSSTELFLSKSVFLGKKM